jgi:hypothetical protein
MVSQKEMQKNREEITSLLLGTNREGIEKLVGFLEESDFFKAPSSTQYHGNEEGGLAYHSLLVYQTLEARVKEYGLDIPQESVIIAGLCHDVCKTNFYIPNLKDGKPDQRKPYKVEDTLPLGHGEKSVYMLQKYIQLTDQEAMLIRWHMGTYDKAWSENENWIRKKYPETLLLHHADNEVSTFKNV